MRTGVRTVGRSKRTVGAGALLALAIVASCGDDDAAQSDGAAAVASEDAETSGDAGAVTVEHNYGETTLDAPPERIVSLDTQWTDVLSALDAPLVGAGVFVEGDNEPYPWQEIDGAVELIRVGTAIPYEAVARLRPDLIVITYGAVEETDYERLSEIAPTIPLLSEGQVDAWEDIAAAAGEILGVPDEAAQLVTDAEDRAAQLATELSGLEGRTFAFANYVPGDQIYVLVDPDDGANVVFSQLGLEIEPGLLEAGGGASGRIELSFERIDELSADLLLLLANGADPADIPGYANLPAVRDGAAQVVDLATAVALNTPSPLSVPYALEQIRPTLEAASG